MENLSKWQCLESEERLEKLRRNSGDIEFNPEGELSRKRNLQALILLV